MKMVWIIYNQAIGEEVDRCLKICGVECYTKFPLVHGIGQHSGPHMGTHVWPATNSLLAIVCDDERKDKILEQVRSLRDKFKKEGIKAFVMRIEEIT